MILTTSSDNLPKGRVKSHTPGRLRFKLHPKHRSPGALATVKSRLGALSGIHSVRTNPEVGSVTIHYDHRQHSMSGILRFLEDLDIVIESIGHLPTMENAAPISLGSPDFIRAIEDLNEKINGLTGLPVRLNTLIPAAFLAAGAWSISRRGLMIERVPGWVFLWFAFDLLIKLNPTSVRDDK